MTCVLKYKIVAQHMALQHTGGDILNVMIIVTITTETLHGIDNGQDSSNVQLNATTCTFPVGMNIEEMSFLSSGSVYIIEL